MARAMTRVKVGSSSTSSRCGRSSPSVLMTSLMVISLCGPGQTQLGERAAVLVVVQLHRSPGAGHAGLAEEQPEPEALALGGEEGFADLLGDAQRHTGTVIADADADFLGAPVQPDVEILRAGVRGVVEQVEQGLGQVRRHRQTRRRPCAATLVEIGR